MINPTFKNFILVFILVFIAPLAYGQVAVGERSSSKASHDHVTTVQPGAFGEAKSANNGVSSLQSFSTSSDVEEALSGAVKLEKRFYPAGKNNYRIKTVKIVDHQKIVPVLVESLKEQQAEIQKLKAEVEALK